MSGLVDMWTSELAKLKNKAEAEADLSNGSASPPSQEAAAPASGGGGSSLWWSSASGLAQVLRAEKLPALKCSETSLSMLMDSFSA